MSLLPLEYVPRCLRSRRLHVALLWMSPCDHKVHVLVKSHVVFICLFTLSHVTGSIALTERVTGDD